MKKENTASTKSKWWKTKPHHNISPHTIAPGSGWKKSAEIVLERETTHKHKQRRNYTDSKNN